jgi:hypothetical protein
MRALGPCLCALTRPLATLSRWERARATTSVDFLCKGLLERVYLIIRTISRK